MDLINETGLKAAWIAGKIRYPVWAVTLVVKGTFDLRPGEPARLSEVQLPPTGDEHVDEDPEGVLRYPGDFGLLKPGADVLLVGRCHARGGRPIDVCRVTFQAGGLSKSLAVIGNRTLTRGLFLTKTIGPEPFTAMDLSYRNAFGGPGSKINPLGKGFTDETGPSGEKRFRQLPNIEDPVHLITDWNAKHPPVGFGPIPPMWPQRISKSGTYKKKWQKERWPFYPEDFDWSFFNAAPADQQLKGYLRGDEELFFENLHPEHDQYRSTLPGLRVRCFTVEVDRLTERFREVPMVLDTLWVDMEAEKLVLVWRGNRDVRDEKLSFIYQLFVVTEPVAAERKDSDFYQAELLRALTRRKAKARAFVAEPPAPAPRPETGQMPQPKPPDASALAKGAAEEEAKVVADFAKRGYSLTGPPAAPPTEEDLFESLKKAISFAKEKLASVNRPIPAELTELEAAMPSLVMTPEQLEMDAAAELADFRAEQAEEEPVEEPVESGKESVLTRDDVVARLQRKESLDQLDLTGLDLSGIDMSGSSIVQAILTRARLRGTNLAGANLTGTTLVMADLTRANLMKASLAGADLGEANLEGADLSEADLQDADVSRANLRGARLVKTGAKKATFTGADLSRADFTGANLTEANASGARLHGTNLSGATLEGFSIQKCWGRGVIADQANIARLKAAGARLPEASFREAQGENPVWDGAQLYRADFTGACIRKAVFSSAYLEGARFRNANVRKGRFGEASLRHADMTRANLFRSDLEKANLSHANLTHANCYDAEFLDSVLDGAILEGTNLKMTKLSGGVK